MSCIYTVLSSAASSCKAATAAARDVEASVALRWDLLKWEPSAATTVAMVT